MLNDAKQQSSVLRTDYLSIINPRDNNERRRWEQPPPRAFRVTSAKDERLVTSAKREGPREEKINARPLIFQHRDVWVLARQGWGMFPLKTFKSGGSAEMLISL